MRDTKRSAILLARFWKKIDKTTTCWIWKAAKTSDGYGQMFWNDRVLYAHRISYEMHVGLIPEGLHIDHLCRIPLCVNPKHLEPVTRKTNILRGISICAVNAVKTHCKYGHIFTPENIYYNKKRKTRSCRICRRRIKAIQNKNRPSKNKI